MHARTRLLCAALVGAALATTTARPAAAQVTTACVGGPIGCSQVDFFIPFLNPEAPGVAIHAMSIQILNPSGWTFRFVPFFEAEDSDFLTFAGTLSDDRRTFTGVFEPTDALLESAGLRIRAEFDTYGSSASDLQCLIVGQDGNAGEVLRASCLSDGVAVVPEPATVLLLGTGLAGVAIVARRRRRGALDA